MALLGNYSVYSKSPGRFQSGTTISGDRANFNNASSARNMFYGGTSTQEIPQIASVPNGYIPPYSWVLPQSPGGMASYTLIKSIGSITNANLAQGMDISITETMSGVISNAGVNLLGSISGTISSSILLTTDVGAAVFLDAIITTSINVLSASLQNGTVSGAATIIGSCTVISADLAPGIGITANLTAGVSSFACNLVNGSLSIGALILATGSLTSDIAAFANMSADILPYTELSPQSLANAVWNEDLNQFNTQDTAAKTLKQIKSLTTAGL